MLKSVKKFINQKNNQIGRIDDLYNRIDSGWKSSKINLGQIQAANNNNKRVSQLADVEFQVFSQFGDDGIIQWLINQIPLPNKTFVEFGVENYREANTRFLLINNYWSGLVIDGNRANISSISSEQLYTFYDLQAECSFITKLNINDLINSAKFNKDIGILSIDIDGNDYWIWNEITSINPIIVICEYNSLFGLIHPFAIEYKEDFIRGKDLPFNFYGCSICSLCELGKIKGYGFIGCNSAGNNAYFIRNDYLKYIPIPVLTPEQGYVFAGFTESSDKNGKPLRGIEKVRTIDGLSIRNTQTDMEEIINAEDIIKSLVSSNKLTRF